jgi:diguanylate cyclase (GGDEF)-like protein
MACGLRIKADCPHGPPVRITADMPSDPPIHRSIVRQWKRLPVVAGGLLGEPLPSAMVEDYHRDQQRRQLPIVRTLCGFVLLAFLAFAYWDTLVQGAWAPTAQRLRLLCALPLAAMLMALFVVRGERTHRLLWHAYVLWFLVSLSLVTHRTAPGLVWALPTYMAAPIAIAPMFTRWRDVGLCLAFALGVPVASLALTDHDDAVIRLNYAFYLATALGVSLLLYVQSERERRRAYRLERGLEKAAHTDALTGLLSRRRFLELGQARLDRGAGGEVLLYLDLDHFKQINDAFGHDAGDRALRDTARAIREATRSGDLCARLGGEEFVVLLPALAAERVAEMCDGLLARIAAVHVGGRALSASLGVARRQGTGDTLHALMVRADHAMLDAKRAGRGGWCEAPAGLAQVR